MGRERGVMLAEVVVGIAVISIAALLLFGVISYVGNNGANSMLQAQAQSIATAYLNEITGKAFADPDGVNGEASRCLYDDVSDYNGLDDASARDCFGNVVANFRVRVAVVPSALNGVPAARSFRIDVTVDYLPNARVVMSGFRMLY